MILQKEIIEKATKNEVAKSIIDKDWVIGHFLDTIYSVSDLKQKLVFKGGTCIKKCYIHDYRFSEDLDFTCTDEKFELTGNHLKEICKLVEKRSGTLTHIQSLKELRYKNKRTGFEAIIKFWGADHRKNDVPPAPERWLTKIKIEVILYEKVMFPFENKSVSHEYSDSLTENAKSIPCYSVNEILSEKLRSLIQRSYTAPRDYYDIWFLSRHFKELDHKAIVNAFHEKMKYKGHEFTGIEQFINEESDNILKKSWKNSLGHQIPQNKPPEFNTVKNDLKVWFENLFSNNKK